MGYANEKCGIYKITSKSNPDRCYIGSAVKIKFRWNLHRRMLKNNKHHSIKLQRHYNKHGLEDLVFTILICCDKEDLISYEQFFIDTYNPYFNSRPTAGNQLGFKHSNESKEKQRNKRLKYFEDEEHRREQSKRTADYINKNPDKLKELIDVGNKYRSNPENRVKHSELMKEYYKNNPQSQETHNKRAESIKKTRSKEGYVSPLKGKKQPRDLVERQIASRKKTMSNPEYIDPRKGRKISIEIINKRKETWNKNKGNNG